MFNYFDQSNIKQISCPSLLSWGWIANSLVKEILSAMPIYPRQLLFSLLMGLSSFTIFRMPKSRVLPEIDYRTVPLRYQITKHSHPQQTVYVLYFSYSSRLCIHKFPSMFCVNYCILNLDIGFKLHAHTFIWLGILANMIPEANRHWQPH